jgi:hypothetical protein
MVDARMAVAKPQTKRIKIMTLRMLVKLSHAGMLALAMGLAQASAPDSHPSEARTAALVGTWRVQVTTYNCATLAENPPFSSYLTFGEHGTLVESTANPAFVAGQRSSGHGFWERESRGSWRAVSEAFLLFGSTAHGPFPGFAPGSQRLEQRIELTGPDTFASEATVKFLGADGTLLVSGCAWAVGTRLE